MPTHEHTHFDEYTEQNRAKHAILAKYLPAYLNALKNQVDRFHYIDAFAGRGAYEGSYPGSPLLALDIIHDAGLAARAAVSLVEKEEPFYWELKARVESSPVARELSCPPMILLARN